MEGVAAPEAEVGLFTVVKKATQAPDGSVDVSLRWVFDQRTPNGCWAEPPWVPLAGPGALSTLKVEPGCQLGLGTGDLPNY